MMMTEYYDCRMVNKVHGGQMIEASKFCEVGGRRDGNPLKEQPHAQDGIRDAKRWRYRSICS